MATKIGYLPPTRERVMERRANAAPVLDLPARAGDLGFDSVRAGDCVLARPRHEPLPPLAAAFGWAWRAALGTAVPLPARRFVGDRERHLEAVVGIGERLGWNRP
ncbi:MAG: hypothetical protein QF926_04160 [Alphaproteobacteria bacterium]|jgi:hypothetical protein|nr:hypothetical protein [Alphaproteobacteria bacterium]